MKISGKIVQFQFASLIKYVHTIYLQTKFTMPLVIILSINIIYNEVNSVWKTVTTIEWVLNKK